ncbi:zinc finger protein 43-like [Oppia nitens]|uniref:zinc finger protein 43-like n=1 Tax=Oppia nitens TaxID=1686743 RepID=UPI0023D9C779|nr:zinc finger protein 43-like [Oppia nitens]
MSAQPMANIPDTPYFCILIDNSRPATPDCVPMYTRTNDCFLTFRTLDLLRDHLLNDHLTNSVADKDAVDKFMVRHLEYQDQLIKTMSESIKTIPDMSKTIYEGCPACDRIMSVFNIRDEPNAKHELVIRNIDKDYPESNVNHINPHIKYYPFECRKCEEEIKNSDKTSDNEYRKVVKTAVKAKMKQHIIDKHLRTSKLERHDLEVEVERWTLQFKVEELDKLLRKPTEKWMNEKEKTVDTLNNYQIKPIADLLLKSLTVSIEPSVSHSECQVIAEESSEEEVNNEEFDALADKSQVYPCLFCLKKYKTRNNAFDHYMRHLTTYLECEKCNLKFKTIGDFRHHNRDHNDINNLKNFLEYKASRKWVNRFSEYMKNPELKTRTCSLFCPVCQFVSNVYNIEAFNKLSIGETIESHIYHHLQYYPYECIDCSYDDIDTEFVMDDSARQHLKDKHNISDYKTCELSIYFMKHNNSIKKFDELIPEIVDITHKLTNELKKLFTPYPHLTQVFNIRNEPNAKHELVISNIDENNNFVDHINPHIDYYYYYSVECKNCGKKLKINDNTAANECRELVKTSVKVMIKHIIDKHLSTSKQKRQSIQTMNINEE